MTAGIQNLVLVELGPELVAEADFQEHRISVRCVYDAPHHFWAYHVFLIDEMGLQRITEFPSQLRTSSRVGAVHMGMKYAIDHILGVKQLALTLIFDSREAHVNT